MRTLTKLGVTATAVVTMACGSSESQPNGPTYDASSGDATGIDATSAADGAVDAMSAGDAEPDVAAPLDAGIDVGSNTGADASVDAAIDAETDAMTDAASDASPPIDGSTPDAGDAGSTSVSASCPAVLVLATTPTGILGAARFGTSASWVTHSLGDGSTFAPALTFNSSSVGVGVATSSNGGGIEAVTWSAGASWSSISSIAGGSAVARSRPALDANGGSVAHLAYQNVGYQFEYLAYTGTWTALPTPIGVTGATSYGPLAPSIAARGADATLGFVDGASSPANELAAEDLTAGAWAAKSDVTNPQSFTVVPAIAALSAGPELLVVEAATNGQLSWLTRTAGVWTSSGVIADSLTNDPPALAPLPGGAALLAFRGQDGFLYWSTFSSGAWSAVAPFASSNIAILGSPAIAHGVGGDVAEVAFVGTDGVAYAASLTGTTWSTPTMVGGSSLAGVAIAAAP